MLIVNLVWDLMVALFGVMGLVICGLALGWLLILIWKRDTRIFRRMHGGDPWKSDSETP